MLLTKELAIEFNLTACKLTQYLAAMFRKNSIPLTPEQFMLIDFLWNEGNMSQLELVKLMQKDKNSVTKLIDAIEKKKLVVRKQNPNDRRSNIINLTDKANVLKPDAKRKGIAILDQMVEGISEEELKNFISTLHKLSNNMTVISKIK